ncbi:asparagine synthase (glutamine-hydrolyzing) [Dactylosporangium sp. CA-092794]|uniref:asparagine synthase (glutamine-hydrolyzing) n=1 Tax=Dactylosporangium sp. CA-092794 TaxID=3239929 RepID=UPI003D921F61
MCGIAGTAGAGADPVLVRRMCDALVHRGPDDEGLHAEPAAALGMRRLAIVDVAGGRQPVSNEDGTVVAICNGELYNFPELRADLLRRGHRFTGAGDTECLVHLYEEYGDDLVHRLRGMFAFALWDARRQRLLLARDRVGKKPLYWRDTGAGVAFASEAKALLADPGLAPRLDVVALHHYLTYQYVPAPWSIYAGVAKLPPGHLLTWQGGVTRVHRYWRLDSSERPVPDEDEAAERLRELLLDAVRVRLVGERPLGAFLSGGLDSSAVVAAMARLSSAPVRTFSIGFDEPRFDERRYARMVADRYGTDHHELVVRPPAGAELRELLSDLAWHFDEPFADPSAVPSLAVARLCRPHVTVVLGGDGGDECFGGYRRYTAMRLLARLPALPPRRLLQRLGHLAGRAAPHTLTRRAGWALQLLGEAPAARYGHLMTIFSAGQLDALYTPDLRAELSGVDSLALLEDACRRSRSPDAIGRLIDADINTYLPGDLLAKVDVTTMANSVEARSPLLDQHLLAWAAGLPTRLKVRGGTTKYLFKRAMAGWLPAEVIDRPKMGFGVPLAQWLRGDLSELTWSLLTDDTARGRGLFRQEHVRAMLRRHADGVDESRRLWSLLQFELWHRRFLDRPAAQPAAAADGAGPIARP